MNNPSVFAVATMDTKGEELQWVVDCIRTAGVSVCSVDVSTQMPAALQPDITADRVLQSASVKMERIRSLDRGAAVTEMGAALTAFLLERHAAGEVAGVLGIGGSGGTALITAAMRQLPAGLPKLMVSTVASGNTAAYVDCTDICMMPSIVDVAGLNAVSSRVLANAAFAMAGMVQQNLPAVPSKPALGMTMFGVTTECVTAVRRALESQGFDCLVFHATGTGGRAMEQLVRSGLIQGILDITTTEVADEIAGGVFACGPDRFDATLSAEIPFVLSLGALDMVNFGPAPTVPEKYQDRLLHVHNSQVTLMRTNADENRRAAVWIANKLMRATSPVTVLIPELGVSALDRSGQPFFDPLSDGILFDQLESQLRNHPQIMLRRLPLHINDPDFSKAVVDEFVNRFRQVTSSAT